MLVRIQSQRARQAGDPGRPAEIDAAIANIREDNRMSEEVLARLLQERGMTQEEYRRDIEDQIRLSKLVQREIRAKVTATDEEVAAWFNEHRQDWYRPEKIRIRHLLIPLPKGAAADEVEARPGQGESRCSTGPGAGWTSRRSCAPRRRAPRPTPTRCRGRWRAASSSRRSKRRLSPCPSAASASRCRAPPDFTWCRWPRRRRPTNRPLEDVRASIEQKIVERKTRERYDGWVKQLRSEAIVEIRY